MTATEQDATTRSRPRAGSAGSPGSSARSSTSSSPPDDDAGALQRAARRPHPRRRRRTTLTLEVAQHIGDNMVRAISLQPDRRPGARRTRAGHRRADLGAGRRRHQGPRVQRPGRAAGRRHSTLDINERWPIHRALAAVRPARVQDRDVRDRHQGHRPADAVRAGREDRPVRRRRRRQDRAHPGDDPPGRQELRWRVGVRRRGRAHP